MPLQEDAIPITYIPTGESACRNSLGKWCIVDVEQTESPHEPFLYANATYADTDRIGSDEYGNSIQGFIGTGTILRLPVSTLVRFGQNAYQPGIWEKLMSINSGGTNPTSIVSTDPITGYNVVSTVPAPSSGCAIPETSPTDIPAQTQTTYTVPSDTAEYGSFTNEDIDQAIFVTTDDVDLNEKIEQVVIPQVSYTATDYEPVSYTTTGYETSHMVSAPVSEATISSEIPTPSAGLNYVLLGIGAVAIVYLLTKK